MQVTKVFLAKFSSIDELKWSTNLSGESNDRFRGCFKRMRLLYIFQTTKDGNHKGAMEDKHNVDVVIEVPERVVATPYGRYNQGGEMKMFT